MATTEVVIDIRPELAGCSVAEIESANNLTIYGVFRSERRLFGRKSEQRVAVGDIVLLGGGVGDLRTFLRRHRLQPALSEPTTAPPAERVWVEAIVMPHSSIVGSGTGSIAAFIERGVQVDRISPHRTRVEGRLSDVAPSIGDVILVRGRRGELQILAGEQDLQRLRLQAERSRAIVRCLDATEQRLIRGGLGDEAGEHRRGLLPVKLGVVILAEQERPDHARRDVRQAAQLARVDRAIDVPPPPPPSRPSRPATPNGASGAPSTAATMLRTPPPQGRSPPRPSPAPPHARPKASAMTELPY